MADKKIIPSILNKIRSAMSDDQGWFRQGKFTPFQEAGSRINYQKQTNPINNFLYTALETGGRPIANSLANIGALGTTALGSVQMALNKPAAAENTFNFATKLRNFAGTQGSFDQGTGWNTIQKGTTDAIRTGLTGKGFKYMTPANLGLSGLIGGGISKATGGSFAEGAGGAVGNMPAVMGFVGSSNPLLSELMPAGLSGMGGRVAGGIGNVAQGLALDASTGMPTTKESVGLDLITGLIGGPGQFGATRSISTKTKTKFTFKQPLRPDEGNLVETIADKWRKTKDIGWEDHSFLDNLIVERTGAKRSVVENMTPVQKLNELLTQKYNQTIEPGMNMGITNQSKGVIPEVGEKVKAVLDKNSKLFEQIQNGVAGKDLIKLTPDEIKLRDEFFRYTARPEVNAKYEAGAKDSQIIQDFLKVKYQPEVGGIKPALIDKKIDLGLEAKKTDLDIPKVEEVSKVLPWEEPAYVSKNLGLKTKTSPELKTGTLKQELNQLQSKDFPKSRPIISPALASDIQKLEGIAPKKVNLLDWFRTPDRVLKKIGLEREGLEIRDAYNKYLDELPVEIGKISKWYDQVSGNEDSSRRLFQYLDGQDVKLDKNEMKVAGEIKAYLKEWADKLDLPYDKRVSNYITHIFEKDFIKKDFDDDLAKIISEQIPSSVYDPFTQKRLGKQGYVEDVFRALDAYTKRAVRKVNMDPALESLSKGGEKLPLESWKYVKSYTDRINLRPTDVDNYIDALVKQSPIGYKLGQRPVTGTSRELRRMVYRGTLGLNVGSALRNLTQGVNTYAKLGEKYTGIGYIKALKEMSTGGDELVRSGVLRDNFIQDRQLSSSKRLAQKLDDGLFVFFNLAEKINRGSAYFGAKAKYLDQGLSEKEAVKKAVDLVRDTQFTFGSVDTPVAMQSDLAKTLGQFQSFNMKQTEFLGEMIGGKDIAGMMRWIGGNALMMFTVGNLIGIDIKDIIPFGSVLTGETKLGATPPIQLAGDLYGAAINAPDKFGNVSEEGVLSRVGTALGKNAPAFIPGGVQAKKTLQGIKAVGEEGSYSKSGRLQYPIEKTPENYLRAGLFGKSNLPSAREYFDNDGSVLGEKQTDFYKQSTDKQGLYKTFMTKRQEERALKEAKASLETSGGTQEVNGKVMYLDDSGSVKTIDIGKVSKMPEQTNYQKALKQKEAFKLVDDVLDNLPEDQQIDALKALGITAEDATYYNTARQTNYLKSIYVEDEIRSMVEQGMGKEDILGSLANMRREINEKVLLADGVITDLVSKNIISYQDGKNLKNIGKDLKPKSLKAKAAKKPKQVSVNRGSLPTLKKAKFKPISYKVKKSTKSRFRPPKYVKANFTTPKKLL